MRLLSVVCKVTGSVSSGCPGIEIMFQPGDRWMVSGGVGTASCVTVVPPSLSACMIGPAGAVNGFPSRLKSVRLVKLDKRLMSLIWLLYRYS